MDNDNSKVFVDHEMTAHVFGGTSSPVCPNYALQKTVADDVQKQRDRVSESLWGRYAEEFHKCKGCCWYDSESEIIVLGRWLISKWIQKRWSERQGPGSWDPSWEALGVKWNIPEDILGFIIYMDDKPTT